MSARAPDGLSGRQDQHVPVGTGQQVPPGQSFPANLPKYGNLVPNAATVHRQGDPSRQVPLPARRYSDQRNLSKSGDWTSVIATHAAHSADRDTEVRQAPGKPVVVVTKKVDAQRSRQLPGSDAHKR